MVELNPKRLYPTQSDLYDAFYPHKNKNHKHYVTRTQWNSVISHMSDVLCEELFNTGEAKMMAPMGQLLLQKNKPKKQPIDWKHFRETGERIAMDNSHTDGNICVVTYRQGRRLPYNNLHTFKLTRKKGSQFNEFIRENPQKLYNYNNYKKK